MQRRTIDNSGSQLNFRTREGGDLRTRLDCYGRSAQGREPLVLAQYEIIARVRDDSGNVHTLPCTVDGHHLTLCFTCVLTKAMGTGPCNYAVELRRDGATTPLVYGTITCEPAL